MATLTPVAPIPTRPDVTEFLARLELLYADAQRWLPAARFSRSVVELDEMATGPYTAPVLEVTRPDAGPLRFVPRARYMLGGSGMVDLESNLGSETLVWVLAGAPEVGFKFPDGTPPIEVIGAPTRPALPAGWVWVDGHHHDLVHLNRDVFLNRVVDTLS